MKLKFGAIVTDGRGKIGGHVISKNRGGSYMKTKVTPSNPRTSFQLAVRSFLAFYSGAFRSLSQSQIASWNATVDQWGETDIFGDIKKPSGINLFVKLNANNASVGAGNFSEPPSPQGVYTSNPADNTVVLDDATFTITPSASSPEVSTVSMIAVVSPQLSPGQSANKGKLKELAFRESSTGSWNILAAYTGRFGIPVTGQKIAVGLVYVNTDTGEKSVPTFENYIVG